MERERGGRVKVINHLLVATAKNLQNKNKNIDKKNNKQTMQSMLQLFQLPLRAAPAAATHRQQRHNSIKEAQDLIKVHQDFIRDGTMGLYKWLFTELSEKLHFAHFFCINLIFGLSIVAKSLGKLISLVFTSALAKFMRSLFFLLVFQVYFVLGKYLFF